MKTEPEIKYISREEWLIRLMQGMVGDYGNNPEKKSICYYGHRGSFFRLDKNDDVHYPIDLQYFATSKFWITDTKGIPYEPLNIINIKG